MPFYQFNQFTGRLKPSTNFQPLYPISPVPLQKAESVMYDTIKTKPVKIEKANYSTDKPVTLNPKMWSHYKLFKSNAAISKPVFLAFGKRDKFFYRFIVAYIGLGTLQSIYFISKEVLQII